MIKFVLTLVLGLVIGLSFNTKPAPAPVVARYTLAPHLMNAALTDAGDMNTNSAVEPAGPAAVATSHFVQWFGVRSEGVYVIWLVREDGHIFQLDPEHQPKHLTEFMSQLDGVPHSIYSLKPAECF